MLKNKLSKDQIKDTGSVASLVLIYIGLISENSFWIKLAFAAVLLTLIIPSVFKYPAVLWFEISEKLGSIVSRIVLGIIYFIIVLPVGLLRRFLKKDSMGLKDFKKEKESSWSVREHKYSEYDFNKPF